MSRPSGASQSFGCVRCRRTLGRSCGIVCRATSLSASQPASQPPEAFDRTRSQLAARSRPNRSPMANSRPNRGSLCGPVAAAACSWLSRGPPWAAWSRSTRGAANGGKGAREPRELREPREPMEPNRILANCESQSSRFLFVASLS